MGVKSGSTELASAIGASPLGGSGGMLPLKIIIWNILSKVQNMQHCVLYV